MPRCHREHRVGQTPETPWAPSVEEVLAPLQVDPAQGLDSQAIRKRRKQFGPNRLREACCREVG
jgi:hypothetical protein